MSLVAFLGLLLASCSLGVQQEARVLTSADSTVIEAGDIRVGGRFGNVAVLDATGNIWIAANQAREAASDDPASQLLVIAAELSFEDRAFALVRRPFDVGHEVLHPVAFLHTNRDQLFLQSVMVPVPIVAVLPTDPPSLPPASENVNYAWTVVLSSAFAEVESGSAAMDFYLSPADALGRAAKDWFVSWSNRGLSRLPTLSSVPFQFGKANAQLHTDIERFFGRTRLQIDRAGDLQENPEVRGNRLSLCATGESAGVGFHFLIERASRAVQGAREWVVLSEPALSAGHVVEVPVWAEAPRVRHGPVCAGSLDAEPEDEVLYVEPGGEIGELLVKGVKIDFTGQGSPSELFTLVLPVVDENSPRVRFDNFGDLNDDGITDLLVVEKSDQNQFVHIFLGPLSGQLTLADANMVVDTARDGGREELDLVRTAVGDVNDDDASDLVVVVPASDGGDQIWVFDHEELF